MIISYCIDFGLAGDACEWCSCQNTNNSEIVVDCKNSKNKIDLKLFSWPVNQTSIKGNFNNLRLFVLPK